MPSDNYGILFDLDQTLIDSQCIKSLRDNRNWNEVFKNLHRVMTFEGISDLLFKLNMNEIKIGIISSSPRHYCEKIIQQNGWVIDAIVGYHDTGSHKPYPDPILLGLKKINVSSENALSIGDLPKDIIASKKVGVISVGVTWGCQNIDELISSSPDKICNSVEELTDFVKGFYSIL